MIAWLNLRHNVAERVAAVTVGLQRLGYTVRHETTMRPGPRDVLVTWNRIRDGEPVARQFEREGCRVLVMENASWGNDFGSRRWYTLCSSHHNTQQARSGDSSRWDRYGCELLPWRTEGQTVLLPSRGIGSPGLAMPLDWTQRTLKRNPGARVRAHPGRGVEAPFEWDMRHAGRAITWGSGAAIKALVLGIPVTSDFPQWIGAQDNTCTGRFEMFCRLAWAQWQLEEFEDGTAFAHYLRA